MLGLDLYRLGVNTVEEAERLKQLYLADGVDESVEDEFAATVKAYKESSLQEINDRIKQKYTGVDPAAYGALAVSKEFDIGMVICGIKDFEDSSSNIVRGINISSWLLREHRNQGIAKSLGSRVVEVINDLIQSPMMPSWHNRQIWTSIKKDNIASRSAALHAGFTEAGPHIETPGRLLYVIE